ncbi:MAG: hypothetical protein FJ146_06905 [Deltaproteobacteria bacterium]|nr:hypothetical protein [Deltaproteobacteria bacterium]
MRSLYQPTKPRFVLARPLARSFAHALAEQVPAQPIDVAMAQHQHETYVALLQQCALEVLMVPSADDMPDSCFIEDTVVVVEDQAIITRPGAISRRGETVAVETHLKSLTAKFTQLKIHHLSAGATLDGGDVLQIGGRVFVGLSRRTNAAAAYDLATMVNRPVHSVKVASGLHLKSVLSAMDEQTLVVADHPEAMKMAAQMITALGNDLRVVKVPDVPASNVLRLGQTLVIQAGYEASAAILEHAAAERGLTVSKLHMSEFIKADGALTCCSVVIP